MHHGEPLHGTTCIVVLSHVFAANRMITLPQVLPKTTGSIVVMTHTRVSLKSASVKGMHHDVWYAGDTHAQGGT